MMIDRKSFERENKVVDLWELLDKLLIYHYIQYLFF